MDTRIITNALRFFSFARSAEEPDEQLAKRAATFSAWEQAIKKGKLPAGIIDRSAFDRNLTKLEKIAKDSGKPIRIATKSIRVPDLIARVLAKGPSFQGVMCYAAEEAEYLWRNKIDNLLIAYPTVASRDLKILRTMQRNGANVALVLNSKEQMKIVQQELEKIDCEMKEEHPTPLRVVIDVDLSLRYFGGLIHFGVRRSPVRTMDDLRKTLQASRCYSSITVVGAMAYEAVVAGLPDRNPFNPLLNPIKSFIRNRGVAYMAQVRTQIPDVFKAEGFKLEIFNGGGTGSLNYAAKEAALTEMTVGSALLCPHLFDYYSNLNNDPSLRFEPAAFFALQITSISDSGYVTCTGGGFPASGEAGADRLPIPVWPLGLTLTSTEGVGEVQTPLQISRSGPSDLSVGQLVFFRHAKAGELADRLDEYHIFDEHGKGVDEEPVKTYQGMGRRFL